MKAKFLISAVFILSSFVLVGVASAQTSYAPAISYISPISVNAGDIVFVYGTNFDQSSYVLLDGNYPSIVPTSQTSASLSFIVPSNVSPGSHSIQIGIKAARLSNSASLTVIVPTFAYTPSISYISPSAVVFGGTVMVYGTNFGQSSYVVIDGDYPSIVPSSQTNTSLSFVVPSNIIAGSHMIQVGVKASPLSNSMSLTIMVPASAYTPAISFINPSSINVGGTVFVYGSNFDQSSYVVLDGTYPSIVPSSQAGTYLSFVVPSNTNAGSHSIQVGVKAAPLSNSVTLNIVSTPQNPVITSISPSTSVTVGTIVYLYGRNFDQSSYIAWDGSSGTSINPTLISSSYLSFVVPSYASIGSHTVQVGQKASPLDNSVANTVTLNVIASQSTPAPTPAPTPQPNPTPLPADVDTQNPQGACLDLQNNLRYRMRDTGTSDDISSLQDFLQANGYLHTEPTGFFGVLTLKAAKDFQQANGISPTGFVGPITRAKIKALSCQ